MALRRLQCAAGRHAAFHTRGITSQIPLHDYGAPPPLPHYPPDVARARKRIINAAVSTTKVGHTPQILPQGYLPEEHQMWQALHGRVLAVASRHACAAYLRALLEGAAFSVERIPDIGRFSMRLQALTGWQVAPVGGPISSQQFFALLECRQMPCTQYIRPHTKYAFTEDPDCIHEMLGHLPALFIPSWARLSQAFGITAKRLMEEGKEEQLEKLTVMYFAVNEKGLIKEGGEVKAIGASVISGSGELLHAMEHPEKHLPFDVDLVMKYGSTDETDFMEWFFVGESVDDMAEQVQAWMDTL
mmetsp:Transcript_170910/g.547766  ORF Transcript_170910/g.547766 Transcript_170910/m.547766 type:complete len:301 (-) Transcript_170910:173-1075(-)|eukprot:CAMPEP_0203898880 /NCGR_PEP_ID=MMETSP0359-20131031/41358_1 /ASSEMBLY_ACC=CAM_ASM_000338 /TAXON_ID=268821 /ORGANISM="Scrippsiella Hangoei, Strain SHTV-5" /LENGTH=300 /DNA_ID=CAMNT_0050822033 /DNA_START=43 /DNA_END=945 /DNA_ORIENTATION=+